MSVRPTAAVIVPFAGADARLRECLAALGRLIVAPGDELIVADNRPRARGALHAGAVRVLPAAGPRAPGFARNRGAQAARADWLVFLDADTRPAPDLLARYLDPPPVSATGLLAGGIVDVADGPSLAARHSARRGQMSQRVTLERRGRPYAQSANLAVRRHAFEAVGGFDETARAGEDADLCWRLAAAGWRLEERPGAVVEHRSRASTRALLMQLARHGCGTAWLQRRYPGEFPPPRPREAARRVVGGLSGAAAAALQGESEAAAVRLLEAAEACAFHAGRLLLSNRPRRT